jgi:tetratricopeptide (TPR) repeat protein
MELSPGEQCALTSLARTRKARTVDDELTGPKRNQLIEFARAMVDRARKADLAPGEAEDEKDRLSLSFREDIDSKAAVELLSSYRRFFDRLRSQLTRELDAVLLTVERLEAELTTLRGEVQGLRGERQQFLSHIKQTEKDFAASADEFTRQISGQVTRLTDQFTSYLNDVNRTVPEGFTALATSREDRSNCSQNEAVPADGDRIDLPLQKAPNASRQQLMTAETDIRNTTVELSRRRRFGAMRLVFGRKARRSAPRDTDVKAIAVADRARDAGEWETAARLYRAALNQQPNNPPIWVQYGHALKETGNRAEAENAYQKSIELDPDVADTHLQLGHVLKLQGKSGGAAAAYLRALVIAPALHDATKELLALGWTPSRIRQALQRPFRID